MLALLAKVALFVVVISVLVGFHEFGHFWMARRLGVMVERFSIGFGKVLWRYQNKAGIEFCLSAVPLGGYVKMLQAKGNDLTQEQQKVAFDCQKTWRKLLIVLAGPAFNLLLALLLYFCVFLFGIHDFRAVIGSPVAGSPAQLAGLKAGDQLLSIDDNRVTSWADVNLLLLKSASSVGAAEPIRLNVERADGSAYIAHIPNSPLLKEQIQPAAQLGLELALDLGTQIDFVAPDSAAARAGLQAGDVITAIDGFKINHWQDILNQVAARPEQAVDIAILRQQQPMTVRAVIGSKINAFDRQQGVLGISPKIEPQQLKQQQVRVQFALGQAFLHAGEKTYQTSALTLQVVYQLITGNASLKNINGPVGIANHAANAVQAGLVYLLSLMAAISVSLGVMNLLPIPVLDGGHVVYYLLEAIKGAPLSDAAMTISQNMGLILLCAFMALAFYNDIHALWL